VEGAMTYGRWVIAEGWNRAHWYETVHTVHGEEIARMSCGRRIAANYLGETPESMERCKVCLAVGPGAARAGG
jgi:hypothetical protein